jgi:hypothetical protein
LLMLPRARAALSLACTTLSPQMATIWYTYYTITTITALIATSIAVTTMMRTTLHISHDSHSLTVTIWLAVLSRLLPASSTTHATVRARPQQHCILPQAPSLNASTVCELQVPLSHVNTDTLVVVGLHRGDGGVPSHARTQTGHTHHRCIRTADRRCE